MLLLITVCVERGFAVNYKLLLNSTNFFISKPSYTDTLLLSYQHYCLYIENTSEECTYFIEL